MHEGDTVRATVLGYHRYRKTGERLDVRVRFRVRVHDGLITRIDEHLDATYIEAFERYLEQSAQEAGDGPLLRM